MDTRAYGWCSLGPLAPEGASIADDHVQQTGVRMVRGTISLDGIYRPAPGTVVELAYSDGQNWIARIPKRLRVLSSFCNAWADRKVTTISVGCDLRYFDNRKQSPADLESINAKKLLEDNNVTVPEIVTRVSTPPIKTSWIVEKIAAELGLPLATAVPLTNEKIVDSFDMSAGYIAELGKLCDSEGYVCYMTESGQLAFKAKNVQVSSGILLTKEDLIDFSPINTGDLPGEAIFAKYTTIKLKPPTNADNEDDLSKRNWEKDISQSPATYKHAYTRYAITPSGTQQARDAYGNKLFDSFSGQPVMWARYEVQAYEEEQDINYVKTSRSETIYDTRDRVQKRTTTTTDQWGSTITETTYTYKYDTFFGKYNADDDELLKEVTIEYSPVAPVHLSMGLQASYGQVPRGNYQSLRREVSYSKNKQSGITRTKTQSWIPFMNTDNGAEVLSRLRDRKRPWDLVTDLVIIATRLVPEGATTQIRTERQFGIERRPSESERTSEAWKDAPDIEESVETTWAIGSSASQTAIELSPPYVPDDKIIYQPPNTWTVISSDAQQKSLRYAQVENRLLLGHRNGAAIQILPYIITNEPLQLVYIRLNGATAAYLLNGCTWNISSDGVTATADALFWGAVDGDINQVWYPLAPGMSSLPSLNTIQFSANPLPSNSISIPQGFNFQNPNLSSLFGSLPTSQGPIYAKNISPQGIIQPYTETIKTITSIGAGCFGLLVDWGAPIIIPTIASIGAGCRGSLATATIASIGAGCFENKKETIASIGAGCFGTLIQVGNNFAVEWSQFYPSDPLGGPDWSPQTPIFSSTATTATMSVTYTDVQSDTYFDTNIVATYSGGLSAITIASIINGVETPGYLTGPEGYEDMLSWLPQQIDIIDFYVYTNGSIPTVSGTMTLVITLTKA